MYAIAIVFVIIVVGLVIIEQRRGRTRIPLAYRPNAPYDAYHEMMRSRYGGREFDDDRRV